MISSGKLTQLVAVVSLALWSLTSIAFPQPELTVVSNTGRSEISLHSLGATEYPFLNLLKESSGWNYSDNAGVLKPDELDSNGYPLSGGAWVAAHGGAKTYIYTPSQYERPGHYVFIWTGLGAFRVTPNDNNVGLLHLVGCRAGKGLGFGRGVACDNTSCSPFTGSISGNTLTVTTAPTGPGCFLGAGVPITGPEVTISPFGTPTIITTAGTACGPNTCYEVNQSQSVSSETMQAGGRIEIATSVPMQTTTNEVYLLTLMATGSGSRHASNFAFLFNGMGGPGGGDEAAYWTSATPCGSGRGCIVGAMFKTRIQQLNPATLRDLDWFGGNVSNCATWASRKPIQYAFYNGTELRNASGGPGQYVNAGGTGASRGTVSYNSGTDVYSITLGSGGPVDKQSILMLAPATGDGGSKISLNGSAAIPILTPYGFPTSTFGTYIPVSGGLTMLIYDAALGAFMSWGGSNAGNNGNIGFTCGVPPEVFVEVVAELEKIPWHVIGQMSVDPMTDWLKQYATYIKTYYPSVIPRFEATNEPWNCVPGPYSPWYLSAKSAVYIAQDANHAWRSGFHCGDEGNYNSEIGKIVSTMGQALNALYGAGNYDLVVPVFTAYFGTDPFADVLRSTAYLGQSMPAQLGYDKTPAYRYANHLSTNNYWVTGLYQTAKEVALGYCYFNYQVSPSCQSRYASQADVMTTYMRSSTMNLGLNKYNLTTATAAFRQWRKFASTCGGRSRPDSCALDQATPLEFYEGGLQIIPPNSDFAQPVELATNASSAVLKISDNGCVPGQTVALSNASGGAWSAAVGSYTVQSEGTDSKHCAINLNSVNLGVLSSATLTYSSSKKYVGYLIEAAYLAPETDALTTMLYEDVIANGGLNPSQYQMASSAGTNPWLLLAFDIYGYFPVGSCTACTIAGSKLTLGGTVKGAFRVGDTLFAGGRLTGLGTGAANNTTITACNSVGPNVCGTAVGDTLELSQSSTISTGIPMTSNATPQLNQQRNSTTSPARAWGAICRWNRNGDQCNG